MARMLRAMVAAMLLTFAGSAPAALNTGARAPDFRTSGALAGKPFRLRLYEQLRNGPVVLYFYPKAFTEGCTFEAHAFSEAAADFRALGARVVGLSADDLPTLRRFSVEACRNAFPVATATPAMINGYDVRLRPEGAMSNRTSYLIAPNGRVLAVHSAMDWRGHVPAMMEALRKWRSEQRPRRRG